jgi:hypothetical protein
VTAWLWKWFRDEEGAAGGSKAGRCPVSAADEALARSCVAALRGMYVGGWPASQQLD